MRLILPIALLMLAACGADGPPERPAPRGEAPVPEPGLIISGTASIGVTG